MWQLENRRNFGIFYVTKAILKCIISQKSANFVLTSLEACAIIQHVEQFRNDSKDRGCQNIREIWNAKL